MNDVSIVKFLEEIFKRLNESDIEYCVLRNYESLPENPIGDIDILVKKENLDEIINLIKLISTKYNFSIVLKKKIANHTQIKLFNDRSTSSKLIEFDIQTDLGSKGIIYCKASDILNPNFLTYYKNIKVPKINYQIYILLFHCIVDKGKFKNIYWKKIYNYVLENKEELLKLLMQKYKKLNSEKIIKLIEDNKKNEILSNRKKILKKLDNKWNRIFNKIIFNLENNMNRIYRMIKPPGDFIAIVGPDGSGKTTIARNTIKILETNKHKVRYFYLGAKQFKINNKFKKSVKSLISNNKSTSNKHSKNNKIKIIKDMILVTYYSIRYFIKYLEIYILRLKSIDVISDRYYYELITGNWYQIPSVYKKILVKIMPNPKVIILLLNKPETIYERKKELSIEEIELQLNQLLKLREYNLNLKIIKTDKSIEKTSVQVINEIFNNKLRN